MHTGYPRLLLAGSHSGSGKTTVSLALMRLLSRRGYNVVPFKVGPDYIDPAFHAAAANASSRNLDPWLLPENTMRRLFKRAFHTAAIAKESLAVDPTAGDSPGPQPPHLTHIAVIEGVMGMYDGLGTSAECSSAHVAGILKAPVILVINAQGISLSAAALVQGFANFTPCGSSLPTCTIAGVVLNKVSSPIHYSLLKGSIEEQTGIPCVGYLRKNAVPSLPHRHLGLVPAEEQKELQQYLDLLADTVEEGLDVQTLLHCACSAPDLPESADPHAGFKAVQAVDGYFAPQANKNSDEELAGKHQNGYVGAAEKQLNGVATGAIYNISSKPQAKVRIGIARDAAFSFYYRDSLDHLENLGAELVPFSPLNDSALPTGLHGLYLGGGFPEMFAPRLEANRSFRDCVKTTLEAGMPTFAECGGMLYLCQSLSCQDPLSGTLTAYPMVGFFPEQAEMTTRLQPFGYVWVRFTRDTVLGPAGSEFPAHEFHYSRIMGTSDPALTACKKDGRNWHGGLIRNNTLAMYPHIHFAGCPELAQHFITFCQERRNTDE